MPDVSMKTLLETGVHFGHQTRRWNPKMKRYIYHERNGIYIIDLHQTLRLLEDAYNFIKDTAPRASRCCSWAPSARRRNPSSRRPTAARCPTSTGAGWRHDDQLRTMRERRSSGWSASRLGLR